MGILLSVCPFCLLSHYSMYFSPIQLHLHINKSPINCLDSQDKSLMNLKRSHSAMSSNNNREEVDEVQFRDDQGEVVIEGRGRGSGREGSSVTAADEEEHRYATLHQQQYQQAAPPSSLHRHSHPRMQQQYQPRP